MKANHFIQRFKRGLALVLTLVLIIGVSGCSKNANRNPYGSLDLDAVYASSGDLKVTNKEIYDELRYSSLDYFNDQIVRAVLSEYIEKLNAEHNDSAKKEKSYDELFVQKVMKEIYDIDITHYHSKVVDKLNPDHTSFINEKINEISEIEKEKKIATYIDKMYQKGYAITKDDIKNLKFDTVFDAYVIELAKYELAKEKVLEKIKETDEKATKNEDKYFTDKNIIEFYDNNYKNINDVTAIIIRFINQNEIDALLKQFGIKTYRSDWYQIKAPRNEKDEESWDTITSQTEYDKYYDDYTINPNGINNDTAIRKSGNGNATILKIFVEIFNYIYTYRGQSGEPALTYTGHVKEIEELTDKEFLTYYNRIHKIIETDGENSDDETAYETLVNELTTSENGKTYLKFSKEKLDKFSSSLTSYMYNTLKTSSEDGEDFTQFTTSSRSYGNYQYFMFKIDQDKSAFEFYTENDEDEKVINEENEQAKKLKEEIIDRLTLNAISESAISTHFEDRMKKAKVNIYDSVLELNYKNSTTYKYSNTKGQNKNLLGSVKIDGKTHDITVDAAYAHLSKLMGAKASVGLLFNKYVKTTSYYTDILEKEMEQYKDTVDAIMVNFANNAYSYYGYPASIGKYNFMKLYFRTTSITAAIKDNLMVEDAKSKLIQELPDKVMNVNPEQFNLFTELSKYTKNIHTNFYSLAATHLLVYVDMDEDGKPDKNYFNNLDANAKLNTLTEELLNTFIDYIKNSLDDPATALTNVVAQYNKSGRIAPSYCDSKNPYAIECKWAKFKREGLFVSSTSLNDITNSTSLNDDIQTRIQALYTNKDLGIIMNAAFTSAYLDQQDFLTTEDGKNILLITGGSVPTSAEYEDKENKDLYTKIPVKIGDSVKYLSAENTGVEITVEQIEIYFREQLTSGSVTSLPASVMAALDAYLKPLITRYTGEAHQLMIRQKLLGTITFANPADAAHLQETLEIAQRTIDAYKDTTQASSDLHNWWVNMFQY